eukprot:7800578-Ditylum_brightwellii.AAC.1
MANKHQYTADDLFGEGKVHDAVQKAHNRVMAEKGLDPNVMANIELVTVADYMDYVSSICDKNDKLSTKMKQMYKKDGQLWNPHGMPPFDDITKVYVAAVQYHNEQYLCSNDVSSTRVSAEESRSLLPTENVHETLSSPTENVNIDLHTPTDKVD